MKINYETSLAAVLKHEGGYVDHPRDPGGATNKGITYRTYNAWRKSKGLPLKSVKFITDAEVAAIYKHNYWNAVRGDLLPGGVDIVMMDFGVNSGPSRSIKFAQNIVGVKVDGQLGPKTLAAIRNTDPNKFIKVFSDRRLQWLMGLNTWKTFGRGWERRVKEVEKLAMRSVQYKSSPVPTKLLPKHSDFIQAIIDFFTQLFRKR